jgi:hypothetical protein
LDTIEMLADEIGAAGITISNGALFSAIRSGNAALPVGTVSTVIDNTAALVISGRFNNLPNGGMKTVNSNNLRASYFGGDGNDLTLTVVP